ncbi:hypothetical protein RclHR1_08230002 [Rhizophagus clarus]|uniref:F-box domain-containing protein n=1 Tax=Rhizophagus clarus TaxID=94130 RepID=A0A2Z6S223_9GLOM|nr:hypothetical protein RclHR1_08230002 [Rhizophagus clarus]GES95535.1 hypothetical protein GLOIN_2v1769480 [Rhizophagus clarus]
MGSYLLSSCLEKIFSYLLEEEEQLQCKDCKTKNYKLINLHSCTLVSRYWCKVSTPILYSYPFHNFRHLSYGINDPLFTFSYKFYNYYKLIRTLLKCMPQSEKIMYDGQQFSFPPTFNYISFIRGLIVDKFMFEPQEVCIYYIETWLPDLNDPEREIAIQMMIRFVKFLFKNCNNLEILEFPYSPKSKELFNDVITSLVTTNINGNNKITKLREFHFKNYPNMRITSQIFSILSKNSFNMNFLYVEDIHNTVAANYLSHLIRRQNNLRHLILSKTMNRLDLPNQPNVEYIEDCIFKSLYTQRDSLRTLELKNLCFANMDQNALNSLSMLENVRELKLIKCSYIMAIKTNLIYWAKNLTKLETLEFKPAIITDPETQQTELDIPEEFLIRVFDSSSLSLKKLVLEYEYDQNIKITGHIHLLLRSLTYLVIPETYELKSILNFCSKLVYVLIISTNPNKPKYAEFCRSSASEPFVKSRFPYYNYY